MNETIISPGESSQEIHLVIFMGFRQAKNGDSVGFLNDRTLFSRSLDSR
jgi:hypothetical protein